MEEEEEEEEERRLVVLRGTTQVEDEVEAAIPTIIARCSLHFLYNYDGRRSCLVCGVRYTLRESACCVVRVRVR